jgi:hypothetical protein
VTSQQKFELIKRICELPEDEEVGISVSPYAPRDDGSVAYEYREMGIISTGEWGLRLEETLR